MNSGRSRLNLAEVLCLDKSRDRLAGGQAERDVVQYLEVRADLARVTGDADPRVVIIAENIIQNGPGPLELGIGGFPFVTLPQLVILGEPLLEFESRK